MNTYNASIADASQLIASDGMVVPSRSVLQDQYQRRFSYLRLSITDACNFRCDYCLPDGYCNSNAPMPLSLAEITRLTQAFGQAGTKKIRVTGGEPTLRKDLPEIIQTCKAAPGIETVALTSNGYRITKQLKDYVDAGLDNLNLSADSLDPSTFALITGHDKLREVLAGLDLALELGIKKVKLNAVLLREYNGRDLDKFLAFVKDRPISLRFIELMQTGDNSEYYARQHIAGKSIEAQLHQQGWQQENKGPHDGPAIEFSHQDYAGRIGLIMPYSKNFCSSCNRLRVAANGQLHTCLFHPADADLRQFLQTDKDQDRLLDHLRHTVAGKWSGHQLEQNYSGDTKHLAMLGG